MNTAFRPSKADVELKFSGPRSTVAIWPRRMIVSPRVATTSLVELLGRFERGLGIDVLLREVGLHFAGRGGEVVGRKRIADIERRDAEATPSCPGSSQTRMAKVEPPRISAEATPLIACRLRPHHAIEIVADLRRRHLLALEADVHQREASAGGALHHRIIGLFRQHALDLVHLRQHVSQGAVGIGIEAKLQRDGRDVLRRTRLDRVDTFRRGHGLLQAAS